MAPIKNNETGLYRNTKLPREGFIVFFVFSVSTFVIVEFSDCSTKSRFCKEFCDKAAKVVKKKYKTRIKYFIIVIDDL
jgi:hypothetical protein